MVGGGSRDFGNESCNRTLCRSMGNSGGITPSRRLLSVHGIVTRNPVNWLHTTFVIPFVGSLVPASAFSPGRASGPTSSCAVYGSSM